jgi:hypothetical protein
MAKLVRFDFFAVLVLMLISSMTLANAKKLQKPVATVQQVQKPSVAKFNYIQVTLPKTLGELLGSARHFKNGFQDGIGFACDQGEVVKTCDANSAAAMPKEGMWGSRIVLGKATNTALLGIKITTKCTASKANDMSGIVGCVYEACLGYSKPITMVCMKQ